MIMNERLSERGQDNTRRQQGKKEGNKKEKKVMRGKIERQREQRNKEGFIVFNLAHY